MKKFYLLMMFALLGMVANAAEVTFDFKALGAKEPSEGGYKGSSNITIDGVTFLGEKGTHQNTAARCWTDGLRIYAGNKITFSVEGNNVITKITFSSGISEWQGSAASVVFDNLKAQTIGTVTVVYEEVAATKVSTPVFSVEEGEYYSSQSISLSCATADASIFYTINDGTETPYVAPIELNESGEYTVKAWATKEGLENSEIVSKTYSLKIGEQPTVVELVVADYCNANGIADQAVLNEVDYINVKFSATKGTVDPKYWSGDWRIYKGGGTLTISAPNGYFIESVDFVGSLNFNELSGNSWVATENTQQVVFTCNDRTDITSITVTLKKADSNQVLAPTFSLTSGTYEGTQSLTMDCATEGATIYYTVNGGDTQTYTDAIELAEGEYAFVAWAEKDGMTKSLEVKANYTIVAPLVANSIAEFLTLGAENADREITLNCDLTVTYQGSTSDGNTTSDLYVQDATGKGLLIYEYNNPEFNVGDVISGVKGKYNLYYGVPQLIKPVLGEVKETIEVSPVSVDASQLTVDNVNDYVVINNVELSEINGANATLNDETATLALYNKYNACTYPEEEELNKKYFVTGIVSVYNDAVQIYPVEITEDTESGVNDAVANEFKAVAVANGIEVNVAEAGLVSVYNAAGQLVANVNVVEGATTINVAGGFYIVKAGNNVAKVLVK